MDKKWPTQITSLIGVSIVIKVTIIQASSNDMNQFTLDSQILNANIVVDVSFTLEL